MKDAEENEKGIPVVEEVKDGSENGDSPKDEPKEIEKVDADVGETENGQTEVEAATEEKAPEVKEGEKQALKGSSDVNVSLESVGKNETDKNGGENDNQDAIKEKTESLEEVEKRGNDVAETVIPTEHTVASEVNQSEKDPAPTEIDQENNSVNVVVIQQANGVVEGEKQTDHNETAATPVDDKSNGNLDVSKNGTKCNVQANDDRSIEHDNLGKENGKL